MIISAAATVMIAVFLVFVFPYASKIENIIAIYNEFTIFLCFGYSFVFLETITDTKESTV